MKKILLTILSFAALLGCSEGDTVTPANPGAISFGNVSTRVDKASDIEEFSVWATVSSRNSDGSVNPEVSYVPILTNERVYRNPAGSNNWTYDNTQIWISNSYFHFFAAHPHNVGFQTYNGEVDGDHYNFYYLNIEADGSADTEDILVASIVKDTTDESFSEEVPVPINFYHLLTKVNLTVSQNIDIDSEFEYYVTKVTISGLAGSGLFLVFTEDDKFIKTWEVDYDSTPITITKSFETPVCLREDYGGGRRSKPISVWSESPLLLIPQEILDNDIRVSVEYLYDVNNNDNSLGTPKTATGFLPKIEWRSNTAINYNISIADTNEIKFEQPTIEPWGAPQTGGTIIIK